MAAIIAILVCPAAFIVSVVLLIKAAVKKEPTKPALIGMGASFAVFVICVMAAPCTSGDSSEPSEKIEESQSFEVDPDEIETDDTNDAEPEHGTTEYVDYISRKAKEDAEHINEEKLREAYEFIREHYPNFYTDGKNMDNDLMEQSMYYGYLLEYACLGAEPGTVLYNFLELGQDTYQAVKYVYRGIDTILDDDTKENLSQIRESLNNME